MQESDYGRSFTVTLNYQFLKQTIRQSPYRKYLSKTGNEQASFLAHIRETRNPDIPYDYLLRHTEAAELNTGKCRVVVISPRREASNSAVLYLSGGCYLFEPQELDYRLAAAIAEETGSDVYLPLYPLFPEHVLHETTEAVLDVVQLISRRYPKGKTAVLGFSSGASLCFQMFMYIRREKKPFVLPQRWILNSPLLRIPASEDDLTHMELLDQYDPFLPAVFFGSEGIGCTMVEKETEQYRYLADISAFDLRGIPQTDIYYGTHETAYAFLAPLYVKSRQEDLDLAVHEGADMMHCWGLYGMTAEGRRTQREYFHLIRTLHKVE